MRLFTNQASVVVVGLLAVMFVSLFGCNSYNLSCPSNTGRPAFTHDHHPGIIFDRTGHSRRGYGVSSERFVRSEWPLAKVPVGYVNQGKIVSYSESTYDEQRVGSDNVPRQYYRRRTRTYSTGVLVR